MRSCHRTGVTTDCPEDPPQPQGALTLQTWRSSTREASAGRDGYRLGGRRHSYCSRLGEAMFQRGGDFRCVPFAAIGRPARLLRTGHSSRRDEFPIADRRAGAAWSPLLPFEGCSGCSEPDIPDGSAVLKPDSRRQSACFADRQQASCSSQTERCHRRPTDIGGPACRPVKRPVKADGFVASAPSAGDSHPAIVAHRDWSR